MRRKSFENLECPIARSLERVGEWWSILILRDALLGSTRFEQFQKNLDIAPNILTRRLAALVESGMLEKRRYSERPPRDEYVLTEQGRDFRPVLWALLAWGNRHFAPDGASLVIVDAETGAIADPVMVDAASLRRIEAPAFRTAPGPGASDGFRERHERRAALRAKVAAALLSDA
ncbi:helix-turn-helix transcriptional regulator [Acidisoma cellulosilytica]|uniref:Helix-turn-helix transcriptional regulator n=1 Tax=Acidisoma cellulosilyticum TaxID=2802395 RepID=A0A964E471_9PROT|nr:helix-turn-helix domain-containing protein [Acidisoma cellulosilyticum]MCB8881174.1 helix-turn-helix transcriptional regulator [Acidisoma cellulosilyticum]